jgi:hypothetical protein
MGCFTFSSVGSFETGYYRRSLGLVGPMCRGVCCEVVSCESGYSCMRVVYKEHRMIPFYLNEVRS